MKKNNCTICEEGIKFIQNLFKIYLEDRNFPLMIAMLHKDVSWFGTGAHEICRNFNDAVDLLERERTSWDGHFKILNQWYQAEIIDNDSCVVFGELKIIEDGFNVFLLDMDSRFTMVCRRVGEELKLYHGHFSVANSAQTEDEFMHKSIVKNYNMLLEKKLEERTKLLRDKTEELETLADNIYGGVQICTYDDDFTIMYASDGFIEMVGYTKDEIKNLLNNKHTALVFPGDLLLLESKIAQQLEVGNNFSIEYRIVRKDGNIIWVIDKGIIIPSIGGQSKLQCILTDITAQKEKEEALIISDKKYEIAMSFSDITMFEYSVINKRIIICDEDSKRYGLPIIIENGVDTLIKKGFILPESADNFKAMYTKIEGGAMFAKGIIHINDPMLGEGVFEMSLANIFDSNGWPTVAVGVKKDVTETWMLQREKEYVSTMTANQLLVCEANVSRNKIIQLDKEWIDAINDEAISSFSKSIKWMSENIIAPEHKAIFVDKLSSQFIMEAFLRGQRLISFEYRRKVKNGDIRWFKTNINIIKDQLTGDISIRRYIEDINDEKIKELRAVDDKKLYETMVSKATTVYEINISKNILISGNENWEAIFGINVGDGYSEMIKALGEKGIHPEDVEGFNQAYLRKNVVEAYEVGNTKIVHDYRRLDESGEFVWVRCTFHLFEEPNTGDLKGYSYVENIDMEKKREIDLIYRSEHDSLTNLYNKASTEKYITDFLSTSEGKARMHGFFIMDIDYFKPINDSFGHAFGDAVLSQVAVKIKELFRTGDILGRIGGDEFVVFMKNIQDKRTAIAKAQELCSKISDSFTLNDKQYKLSVSVGIALYKEHGENYSELYKNSDTALYVSKENGRNQFTMYSDNMITVGSQTNEIISRGFSPTKNFGDNVCEYIFRILYESNDKIAAIDSVLELIGKHYNISRAYIFEDSSDGSYADNTFGWYNKDITLQMHNVNRINHNDLENFRSNFSKEGILFIPDINKDNSSVKTLLEGHGVKSLIQFAIVKNSELRGFIGFDQCNVIRVFSKKEVSEMQNIANILGMFIIEMRMLEENNAIKNVTLSIINGLDSYAYVCDPKTYKVLFANDKAMGLTADMQVGNCCYGALWGSDTPCRVCPMKTMIEENRSKYSMVLHNYHLGIWIKTTASWINWLDGKKMCLIDNVDITEYR